MDEVDYINFIEFLDKVKNTFDILLEQPHLFVDHELFRQACNLWKDELAPEYDNFKKGIKTLEDKYLTLIGLRGTELTFKLNVFNFYYIKKLFKKILQTINSILGSLAAIYPPAEKYKEFKDMLELIIF